MARKRAAQYNAHVRAWRALQKGEKKGEAAALKGIVQGVGQAVGQAVGTAKRAKRRGKGQSKGYTLQVFDAFSPQHLPLPRAVGEYTVVRYTQVVNSSDPLIVFGTFESAISTTTHGDNPWSSIIAVGSSNLSWAMNDATAGQEAAMWAMDSWTTAGNAFATFAPAAFSVQVMNPNALQTTSGICYIGRMKTVPGMMNNPQTWQTFATNFTSYNAPRLCSAAKLAMRGVQVDAIPMNMAEVSDFKSRVVEPGFARVAWNGSGTPIASAAYPSGFTPIVVYNPNGINLQFLVCMELRTRFDPQNPAQAGHVFHPVASDSTWDRLIRGASSLGHGCVDIVERVAQNGERIAEDIRGVRAIASAFA